MTIKTYLQSISFRKLFSSTIYKSFRLKTSFGLKSHFIKKICINLKHFVSIKNLFLSATYSTKKEIEQRFSIIIMIIIIIIIIIIIMITIIMIIIQRKLMAISIVTPKNTKHQNCKNQKSTISQAMIKKEIRMKMFLKATTYSSKKILIWNYGGLQTTTVVLLPLVRLARHSYGMLKRSNKNLSYLASQLQHVKNTNHLIFSKFLRLRRL